MPANPIINRRSTAAKLRQRSLVASDDAVAHMREQAARMHVSQGSLLDVALKTLLVRPPREIARLLLEHRLLTEDEHALVLERLTAVEADDDPA